MKYDFDRVVDRTNSDSAKWNVSAIFGRNDIIPMWVADMDFPVPGPVTEALRKRVEHEIYGYAYTQPSLLVTIVDRMKKKYGWKIEPEWIVFTPGVIPAISAAIQAYSQPGDEVIIHDPVYHPFWSTIEQSGRRVAGNPLKLENGHYEIDIKGLEGKFTPKEGMRMASSRIKMMVLCSPHNPVGRVWTRDELSAMGEVMLKHNIVMVSDEVHCELLFDGHKHVPFASISEEFARNSIVCQAGSKTFNLAGLGASTIIIPDRRLRDEFNAARSGIMPQPSILSLVALEAAYRDGDEWLEQVLDYIQNNLDFTLEYFKKYIPRIRVIKPQGTYLVWLDCRDLKMDKLELQKFVREKAKVGFDDGFLFGAGGGGFQRMNIACPRSILEEALTRIKNAVNSL